MQVCRERPPHLPPLHTLGLEPVDQTSHTKTPEGSGRYRHASAGVSESGPHSASLGLGVGGFKHGAPPNPLVMNQFSTPGSKLTSEERFMLSSGARSASVGSGPAVAFQGEFESHPGNSRKNRTRSKRGEKHSNSSNSVLAQQGPGSLDAAALAPLHESVTPLEKTFDRWEDVKLPLPKPNIWAAPAALQNTKFQLLPRTEPTPGDLAPTISENEPETALTLPMSGDAVKKRIDEDVKEFFAIRDLEEADVYFIALPEECRFLLIDKLVASALESKEADARLVAEFFARPASQRNCSLDVFEAGFIPMAELLDDIAIDAPKAFEHMAIMLKGAGFDRSEERLRRIAEKAMDSDKLLQLVTGT